VFIHHLLDLGDPGVVQLKEFMTRAFGRAEFRTLDRVRDLFCGLELVEPGLVRVRDWRPDGAPATGEDEQRGPGLGCAGVARKP
jgi:S-adenosyl methyltransferase